MRLPLTLAEVAQNPADFTTPLQMATGEQLILRPLIPSDGEMLTRYALRPNSISTPLPHPDAERPKVCAHAERWARE